MDTFEKIQEILANLFQIHPDQITMESDLSEDLLADELDNVEIIMAVEDEFNITIHDEDATEIKTVGDLVKLVDSLI
jgi:acyl carrier protein